MRLSEIQQRQMYLSLSRSRQKYASRLDQTTKLLNALKDGLRRGGATSLKGVWANVRGELQADGRLVDDRDLFYWWAFDGYRPGWYDGEVTLFLSDEWMATLYDQVVGGWHRLAGRVVVHGIGGTHHSCVTDRAPSLATQLRSCLAAMEQAAVPEAHC
jgi:hypothetical protein